MKTRKTKAIIMAIAAATGTSVQQECAAARMALQDMKNEFGTKNVYSIEYTYNPFDGMLA